MRTTAMMATMDIKPMQVRCSQLLVVGVSGLGRDDNYNEDLTRLAELNMFTFHIHSSVKCKRNINMLLAEQDAVF